VQRFNRLRLDAANAIRQFENFTCIGRRIYSSADAIRSIRPTSINSLYNQ